MRIQLVTFIVFSLLLSCNDTKQVSKDPNSDVNIDPSLVKVLDDYIKEHPIKVKYGEKLNEFYKEGFSHPSYHIYFDKKEKDTLFTITIFPQLHTFELEERKGNIEGESYIFKLYPKGFFTYKKTNPIIVFDEKSIANKFYNREVLHSISDTLITTSIENVRNYKPYSWIYKIKNGKIADRIK
ncbi:hypothetical protein [Aquimarina brevivitae]|uniref:Lipoprotein n=1 Tax=Aquimarina brevivitae TaxID=323412 RepID=A0A4Q7NTU3_9FLAO|nr:hypothetical protein [Aquimarina brevivitae]RZS90547.1 hypothetical protein EV197_3341 [Aquimarina brevivitae]